MSEDIPIQNKRVKAEGWQPYLSREDKPQPWSAHTVWNGALWSFVGVVLVTVIWGIPYVEKRLDRQSHARLNAAGIDASTLNLRWSYRDLSVFGELPADISAEQLIDILRREDNSSHSLMARGIRDLNVHAEPVEVVEAPIVIPEELPLLSVTLVMQSNSATLDGAVESSDQRQLLVEALLATGVESIRDNLEVSEVEDELDGVDVKVRVLANMVQAAGASDVVRLFANLDRHRLDYHVTTLNREAAVDIENAARVAIINFDISGEATVAQNAMVNVNVKTDAATMTMNGHVFSQEQHRLLFFAATEAASGGRQVVDNVSISDLSAVQPGSDVRVEGLAEVVARFKPGVSGQIQMRGNDLALQASVENEQLKNTLLEVAAAARGRGIVVSENIVIGSDDKLLQEPAVSLQQKLDALAPQVAENVIFNSGNAVLTNDARFTLDMVGKVLLDFPVLKVEIEGHTDNIGREETNEELSRDRADAVRQYLIERSVDAGRLVAVGYGSRNPLASNDTSEGRRTNRRVHFHVPDPQITEQ